MSSENDENNRKIDDILAEDTADKGSSGSGNKPSLEELKQKIEELEVLLERAGKNYKYIDSLNNYTETLTAEAQFYKKARWYMILFSLILIVFLLSLLVFVLFFHQLFFYFQGPYFRSALVFATIGGSVIVTSLVLRGVFRLATERNATEELPPHMREMANTANTINNTFGS